MKKMTGGVQEASVRGYVVPLLLINSWLFLTNVALAQSCDDGVAVARVESVEGNVTVNQAKAIKGQGLCAGDLIEVGLFGRAGIQHLSTQTINRIDQESSIRILEPPQENHTVIDLLKGIIYLFTREPRAIDVNTRYANASVRGTEFLVSVSTDRTLITVLEGEVLAFNGQGEVDVASNQAAVAFAGQAPRLIEVIEPEDAVKWALYYQPILLALIEPTALKGISQQANFSSLTDVETAFRELDRIPSAQRGEDFHVFKAGLLLTVGRVDEAQQAIKQALAANGQSSDARALQAIIAVTENDKETALQLANEAVAADQKSATARLALSYALQAHFDIEGALDSVQEAVTRGADNALAWARLSELWLSKGELDKSLDAAQQAVELNPNVERTQTVLGFANLTRIDIDAAKQAFNTAIELDQAAPLPRLGLGLAKIRQGELIAGREDIEVAVGLDPLNSLLRSYLGKAYFEEKRNELAGAQYRIAKELDPFDPTPWLYDAIRKQTKNQLVESLNDIQESIKLNENRAVYRSQLLLDEDQATRNTSLARIYSGLGFEQRAIAESTRSLAIDPGNYSAHRFFSDAYSNRPRHEIARVSELLQSQLLQPVNVNPVQPQIAETSLNIVTGIGPNEAAFNEFTSLFLRDQIRLSGSGIVGNNGTLGNEVVVSGINGRFSYSIGQFHHETDGFREEYDSKHDVYNVFGQAALSEKFNIQFEYRRRETEQGDLRLNFDPNFMPTDRRELDQETVRLGTRYSPSPDMDVIGSFIYSDRETNFSRDGFPFKISDEQDLSGYDTQAQVLYRSDSYNLVLGGGFYEIDQDVSQSVTFIPANDEMITKRDITIHQESIYAYANIRFPENIVWTVGLSYDAFDNESLDISELNPKLGMLWSITDRVDVRVAGFKTTKRELLTDQTLEPTQIAGFNQFFDDVNGTEIETFGIGFDVALGINLFSGVEITRRYLINPNINIGNIDGDPVTIVTLEDLKQDAYRAYLYWNLNHSWLATAEYIYERFEGEFSSLERPEKLEMIRVPFTLGYFNQKGIFAEFGTTYMRQNVDNSSLDLRGRREDVFVTNAKIGYRLPKRQGILSLEATNLFDKEFLFQDLRYLTSDPFKAESRFFPDRAVFGRITLAF